MICSLTCDNLTLHEREYSPAKTEEYSIDILQFLKYPTYCENQYAIEG